MYFRVDGDRWWADSWPPYTFGVPGVIFRRVGSRHCLTSPQTAEVARMSSLSASSRRQTTNGKASRSTSARPRHPAFVRPAVPGGTGSGTGRGSTSSFPPPISRIRRRRASTPLFGASFFRGNSLLLRRGKHDFAWEIVSGDREAHATRDADLPRHGIDADAGSSFDGFDEVLCAPDGPRAIYTWAKSTGRIIYSDGGQDDYAQNLELRALKDPCKERRRLLEGVWEGVPTD